jgi:hypothetical protein
MQKADSEVLKLFPKAAQIIGFPKASVVDNFDVDIFINFLAASENPLILVQVAFATFFKALAAFSNQQNHRSNFENIFQYLTIQSKNA